jgi:hypothetical protein
MARFARLPSDEYMGVILLGGADFPLSHTTATGGLATAFQLSKHALRG